MNLIEGIQKEQKRLQEDLIPEYEAIGPAGTFGVMVMNAAIEEGDKAIASGDVVRMVKAAKALQEYTG